MTLVLLDFLGTFSVPIIFFWLKTLEYNGLRIPMRGYEVDPSPFSKPQNSVTNPHEGL